jgi:hypothetical protein
VKPGDKVKLKGKTKHGKNRVREQGHTWVVVKTMLAHESSFAPVGTEIALLRADKRPDLHWRWVEVENDKNFDVDILDD